MGRDRQPAAATIRWYRRILRLYPASLRTSHGDEMVEVVERRRRQVGNKSRLARVAFFARVCSGALAQCVGAWIERGWRGGRARQAGDGRVESSDATGSSPVPRGRAAKVAAFVSELPAELRLATRSLRRAPGFTIVAVLVLALGIGANTAIFSIIEAVLLDPLPYPRSERLVAVAEQPWVPTEITLELRRTSRSLQQIAGFYPRRLIVTGRDRPLELEGAAVTTDFFDLLGAAVVRGRGFTEEDAAGGDERTVIIGHGTWQRLYGGATDVLGRNLAIDGEAHAIVGVLEPGFRLHALRADDPQVWLPLELLPSEAGGAFNWEIPVGRLADGATLEQAQAELDGIMAGFRERHPEAQGEGRWNLRLATLKETLVGGFRAALVVLQAAVLLVLLLACVNVANLLLVRTSSRQEELAVRVAMGASRLGLLRHLVSESVVLSLLGGGAGLLLLSAGRGLLRLLAPEGLPRIGDAAIDGSVIVFTILLSFAIGVACGVVPGLLTRSGDLYAALKGGGRGATGSRRRQKVTQGLAAAEVCLTVVLLVAAGLLARSFVRLTSQDPGFRTRDVTAVSLRLSENTYDEIGELDAFYRRVRRNIEQIPGVEAVAVSNYLPISMGATREYVVDWPGGPEVGQAQYGVVSPDYFRLLDIPLLQGRPFAESDGRGAPPVALIDEAMRRSEWPDDNPVGKRFRMSEEEPWLTVVGVVGSIRGRGLGADPRPGFYVPSQQRPATPTELAVGRAAVILVRSPRAVDALADGLRRAVWEVDPLQPVPEVTSLERVVAAEVSPQRFRTLLLGVFAAIALLTAMAGIYGVVAYLVSERRRELGIRVALGATPRDILSGVLGWGLRLSAVGAALGLIGVAAITRYLSSLLFEVSPTDAATITGSLLVVVLATLSASLVPAWRALRGDPVRSLRTDGGNVEPSLGKSRISARRTVRASGSHRSGLSGGS